MRRTNAIHLLAQQRNNVVAANRQFAANEQYFRNVVSQQAATIEQQNATIQDLRTQLADAFRLVLPLLHAKIHHRCTELFVSGQYEDTIFKAMKTVEDEVRRLIGADEEVLGTTLVGEAFGGPNPRLVLSTIRAEQDGAQALFRGAIGWLKNPRSHRHLDTDDRTAAFEALVFASSLMRMLDVATLSN